MTDPVVVPLPSAPSPPAPEGSYAGPSSAALAAQIAALQEQMVAAKAAERPSPRAPQSVMEDILHAVAGLLGNPSRLEDLIAELFSVIPHL